MKKQNKTIIISMIAIFAFILFFLIFKISQPKPNSGAKAIIVEVVNKEGETKEYQANTDAEYLSQVMDELSKNSDFTYEASESEYGIYIESINSEKADYNTDGAYWAIYVNGEYGQFGADQQPVADSDTYKFVYEK